MSVEIIYDRQFVVVEDKFIPVFCLGSSNCTETNYRGREVAEKHWSNLSSKGMVAFTKGELAVWANSFMDSDGIFKSRHTPFKEGEFTRYILNGMDYAQPVEFFVARRVPFSVKIGIYPNYQNVDVKTSAELLAAIELAKAQNVNFSFSFYGREASWTKEKRNLPKVKENVPGYYVLIHDKMYVTEINEKTVCASKDIADALRFNSKDTFDAFVASNQRAIGYWKVAAKFIRLPKPSETCYLLKQGSYYLYESPNKKQLHLDKITPGTKYFNTIEEAKQFALKCPQFQLEVVPMAKNKVIPHLGYYVLVNDGVYFTRRIKYGYKYSGYTAYARKFKSQNDALKYLSDNPSLANSFKVTYIDIPHIFG